MAKKVVYTIAYIIALGTIASINNNWRIIIIPSQEEMQKFQMDLFTICSVLAGFAFTVMGILTTLLSDDIKKKLKNTSFVTEKSKMILKSIVWCGIPAILAIFFFTGIIERVCLLTGFSFFREYLFITQIMCLLIGIIFFLRATNGVYKLIEKIYGYNREEVAARKDEFKRNLEDLKKRRKNNE